MFASFDRARLRFTTRPKHASMALFIALVMGIATTMTACLPLTIPDDDLAAETETIFGTQAPANPSDPDARAVEVGVKIRAQRNGWLTGVRFYKSTANTGAHVGHIWSSTGTKLAVATFQAETASGWQYATFATPVAVTANMTYVASYHTNVGHYAGDSGYFDGKGAGTGSVRALANGVDGANGVYRYGSAGFPSSDWHAANYWVDVTFVAQDSATTTVTNVPATVPATAAPTTAVSTTQTPVTQAPTTTTRATTPTTTTTPPPTGGFPDASNTGVPAGTTLTPSSGMNVTVANTVIDAQLINGTVTIDAPNVVIKRSKFIGTGDWGILVRSGSVRLEDSEIAGRYTTAGLGFDNWTAIRCNIHGMPDDGFKLGDNVLLQDSWLHDWNTEQGAHADGGQVQNGIRNSIVRHNSIDVVGNSALFIAPDLGPSTNGPLLIEDNLLGGGNYTLYNVDGNSGQYFISNITVRGNRFLRNARYGAVNNNVPVNWNNNVWNDTGAPINY
jgi:hypothetical protein